MRGFAIIIPIILFSILAFSNSKKELENDSSISYYKSPDKIIEILNTKLNIEFKESTKTVIGSAVLKLIPYNNPIDSFYIDAKGFSLNRVAIKNKSNFKNVKFTYDNKRIYIKSDSLIKDTFELFIEYLANPETLFERGLIRNKYHGLYFFESSEITKNQIWSLNQTEGASCWFPTIESPDQRMTQDFYITVKNNQIALSNGNLVYKTLNHKKDSSQTFYWKTQYPHSPYLACIVVGDFKSIKSEKTEFYFSKEIDSIKVKELIATTDSVINFIEQYTKIIYPWEKYKNVLVKDFSSNGMENTSLTVYSDLLSEYDKISADRLIVHETAHQWFGNLVTCKSWANLFMNESFASYFELLWIEKNYSVDVFDSLLLDYYFKYLSQKNIAYRPVYWNYFSDPDIDLFDAITYYKPAILLHSLRKSIGDSVFFSSIEDYLINNKFSSVEYFDFKKELENNSGIDLNWFYNQWIASKTDPLLKIEYEYDSCEYNVKLNIIQETLTDNGMPFYLPINIIIGNDSVEYSKQILVDAINNDYLIDIGFMPTYLIIDERDNVLINSEYLKQNNYYHLLNNNTELYYFLKRKYKY